MSQTNQPKKELYVLNSVKIMTLPLSCLLYTWVYLSSPQIQTGEPGDKFKRQ